MFRSVKGKSAIVTGAGSGTNLEFARILLNDGANVVIGHLALRPEAQKLFEEHSSGGGPRAAFHRIDVSSWADLDSLFRKAEDEFQTFDIVCPGARIFEPPSSGFWHDPQGDRYMSIDINLVHPLRVSQLAIAHFLSSGSPASVQKPKAIVHVNSMASELGVMPTSLYNTTKWGLRGFIYSMGELETRHIRVAGVAPAIVRTPPWLEHEDKKAWVNMDGKVQEDWVFPEEVAEVIYQLCTENEISNKKGESIPVKGGSLIEVLHDDVRDVPIYGAESPDTGTSQMDMTMVNIAGAYKSMNGAIDKIAEARA